MKSRIDSFRAAFQGIKQATLIGPNFQIELVCAIVAILQGYWLEISPVEWAVLFLTIGFVLAAEVFNTAIEQLANKITLEDDLKIKLAKDLAGGAVLIASLIAIGVAIFLFGPRLYYLFFA